MVISLIRVNRDIRGGRDSCWIAKFSTADYADEYGFLTTKERREHERFLGFIVPLLSDLSPQLELLLVVDFFRHQY